MDFSGGAVGLTAVFLPTPGPGHRPLSGFDTADSFAADFLASQDPDRRFWEDWLGFSGFAALRAEGTDSAASRAAWTKAWGRGENLVAARTALLAPGERRHIRLNLLLAAAFVEKFTTGALVEAARVVVGEAAVPEPHQLQRRDRNALAAAIFAARPAGLLAARVFDDLGRRRWYSVEQEGHARLVVMPFAEVDWVRVGQDALRTLPRPERPSFQAAICRPWLKDVVLAFRARGVSQPNRDEDGRFHPGFRDDWIYVQFTERLQHDNIFGTPPEPGRLLAQALARAALGAPVSFVYPHNPLSPETMQEFHARLTQPGDPSFKLLEIEAETPGLWQRPVNRLGNVGQVPIERAIQELWRSDLGFAKDYRSVLRAKLGFEGHRIQIHYPDPSAEDELLLSYVSRRVPPDVGARFEQLFQHELGIKIHPRGPTHAAPRRSPYPEKPTTLLPKHWHRMLAPAVPNPASWEIGEMRRLKQKLLLDWDDEAAFECGSPAISRRPRGAAEGCTGVVLGAFGKVLRSNPFEQPEGPRAQCPACGAAWDCTAQLPWFHRAAVRVNEDSAWGLMLELLEASGTRVNRVQQGVAAWTGDQGDPCEVIALDLAPFARLQVGASAGRRAAWFGVRPAVVSRYGARGVGLADVLGGDLSAIGRAHATGPVPGAMVVYSLAEPAPMAPAVVASADDGRKVVLLQPGDSGAFLGDREIASAREPRLLLLLAAFQYAMTKEGHLTGKRGHYSADLLAAHINDVLRELHRAGDPGYREVDGAHIHQWVLRLRRAIDERGRPASQGPSVIEHREGSGYRLGGRYELRGFSVQDEARRYKADPRTREKAPKA